MEPGSELGRAVWTIPLEELQVFKYTVTCPDLPTLCQNWASYENDLKNSVCWLKRSQTYAARQCQPVLYPIFDFQRIAWQQPLPLNPRIQADNCSRWVILEDRSVFICGGRNSNTAYIIVGERCAEQGRMCVARGIHGVPAYVYVFGGKNSVELNSCEKYELQQHSWSPLPPMQAPRHCFNPCLFNGSIYLCGVFSSLLEAFSPQTNQMLPFQLFMPASGYSPCHMYVENNLLVVHLKGNILKYRAGQAGLVQASRSSTQKRLKSPNSQPVVNAALRVYYIVHGKGCYCVNMDTGVAGSVIK